MFDEYIRDEVIPYIHASCHTPGIPIATVGASLGAYHAANTLFHYPHLVKRCYALSGIFDLRDFMGGMYDDNFYFQNPVDYMANLADPWFLEQLSTCEIRLVTGTGPYEKSQLFVRDVRHSLAGKGFVIRSMTGVRAAGTTGPTGRSSFGSTSRRW